MSTRILHLSDLHATTDGSLYGVVRPFDRLRLAVDRALDMAFAPDLVVISGDLAQRGEAAAYRELADQLTALGERLGVRIATVLGNHDDRKAARVLPGHADGHDRVLRLPDGTHVVLLDSGDGELGRRRLEWLRGELGDAQASPAAPSLVVLHHPPLRSPLAAIRDIGLRDAEAFADVIRDGGVGAVLTGQLHHAMTGALAGVPVFSAPALAYRQSFGVDADTVEGVDEGAMALVELDGLGATFTPVPLTDGDPIFTLHLANQHQEISTTVQPAADVPQGGTI